MWQLRIDSCQNIGTEISHEMDAAQRDWDKEEGHHCECCAFCCVRPLHMLRAEAFLEGPESFKCACWKTGGSFDGSEILFFGKEVISTHKSKLENH